MIKKINEEKIPTLNNIKVKRQSKEEYNNELDVDARNLKRKKSKSFRVDERLEFKINRKVENNKGILSPEMF
jgi:hypothetical protein